jgi:outer membrane protein
VASKAAENSFKLMSEKYANGKANATEYNEMRANWMKALSEQLQARYDYLFRSKILEFYKGVQLDL